MKLVKSRVVLALMAAVLMLLGLATPAQAGTSATACTYYGCYSVEGSLTGRGAWLDVGDKMWVCDEAVDGWSIVVIAWLNGVRAPNKWHTSGGGGCTQRSYGDLAEGTEVKFQGCLGDASDNYIWGCGYTKWGYA